MINETELSIETGCLKQCSSKLNETDVEVRAFEIATKILPNSPKWELRKKFK